MSSPEIATLSQGPMKYQALPKSIRTTKCGQGDVLTGTEISPGVQTTDEQEVVKKGVQILVIGQGMTEAWKVPPLTVEYLRKQGTDVRVQRTIMPWLPKVSGRKWSPIPPADGALKE